MGDTGTGFTRRSACSRPSGRARRTGKGVFVDVSMQEAVTNYVRVPMTGRNPERGPLPRTGDAHGAPTGVFACAPGGPNDHVYLAPITRRDPPDRLRDRLPARAAAGAHTAEVLEQELELDATAIGTLRDQKVI